MLKCVILFKNENEFYSCFHILEDTRHTLYTDKMEFHVLELPKLPKELKKDANDVLLWAKFINAESKEEFDMLASKNKYINSAYQQLQVISQDKQKQMEYTQRMKAVLDYNQGMLEAKQEGLEQGLKQGLEKRLIQGKEESINNVIIALKSIGIEKENILSQIVNLYQISYETAQQYLEKYF